MAFVSSRSTDEYHDLIDDLTIENRTLRQQRDEYGRQLIIMQDQVAQLGTYHQQRVMTCHYWLMLSMLEICTKCEEAHRDAYASRRELAKLQSSINAAESKTFEQQHAGLCATRGDPACESTEADGPGDRELETSASAVVVAGMIERLTYYKNAFSKLQVDNKGILCK